MPTFLNRIESLKPFKKTIADIKAQNAQIASRMINDKQVTDHQAIIPTDKTPNLTALSM